MAAIYSASREICEVSTTITTARPQTVIRPNRWGGIDFDLTRHDQPRVRLAVEDEEGAIALCVFDASGCEVSSAIFTNMPAAMITGVVRSYLVDPGRSFEVSELKGGDIVDLYGGKAEVYDTWPQGANTRIRYINGNGIRSIVLPNEHKVTVYN